MRGIWFYHTWNKLTNCKCIYKHLTALMSNVFFNLLHLYNTAIVIIFNNHCTFWPIMHFKSFKISGIFLASSFKRCPWNCLFHWARHSHVLNLLQPLRNQFALSVAPYWPEGWPTLLWTYHQITNCYFVCYMQGISVPLTNNSHMQSL